MRKAGQIRTALLSFVASEGRVAVRDSSHFPSFGALSCKQKVDSAFWRVSAQTRCFQTGLMQLKDIEVEVQQMGESISEGTIAEILKKEGDNVAEDETIAQIETDKVTIDVKAPQAGTLKSLKVSVDDTVTVGQVVAIIGEGQSSGSEDTSSTSGDSSSSEKPAKTEPSKDSAKRNQESSKSDTEKSDQGESKEQESDHSRSHTPMLKFPQRMTPDGHRISELSAEEQKQYASHGAEETKPAQPQASPQKPASKDSSQPAQPYMSWYVGREQGTKLSQSSVLSDYEMEQIELGGANP